MTFKKPLFHYFSGQNSKGKEERKMWLQMSWKKQARRIWWCDLNRRDGGKNGKRAIAKRGSHFRYLVRASILIWYHFKVASWFINTYQDRKTLLPPFLPFTWKIPLHNYRYQDLRIHNLLFITQKSGRMNELFWIDLSKKNEARRNARDDQKERKYKIWIYLYLQENAFSRVE